MTAINYQARRAWLLQAVEAERFVDVLNAPFVARYADATGAAYKPSIVGAGWCRLLAADLRKMAAAGLLKKSRVGLSSGAWMPGFPKWVNSYSLSAYGRAALDDIRGAHAQHG